MTRKRARISTTSTDQPPSSKIATTPVTPARQSKRIKSAAATPKSTVKATNKKSVYFEQPTDSESELRTPDDVEESGYEDEDASITDAEPTSEEYASSEDEKPTKRGPRATSTKSASRNGNARESKSSGGGGGGGELWREGVRSHLAPGEEVFVELPKARPAGKISYKDHTIHPNTTLFLGDLKAHNERAWLKSHDADFRQAEKDWKAFVQVVTEKLVEVDETIPELPVKDVVFRIYRDVRFSSDPTPYKPHFSAAWSRTGRKGPFALYYLQVGSKGSSFFGGGLWMPNAEQIRLLRQMIDSRAKTLKQVLMQDGIRRSFLGGAPKHEAKVIKAFANSNKEHALKKKPRDYDADHPEIELLKLRNFTLGCKLADADVTSPKFLDKVVQLMKDAEPYVTFMNSVVMPDPGDNQQADADADDNDDDNDDDDDDDQSGDGADGNSNESDSQSNVLGEDSDPGPDPDEPEDWEPQ